MAGPWDKYRTQGAQPVMISPPDPKLPGQIEGQGLSNIRTRQQIGQDAITSAKQQFELEELRKERALKQRQYNEARQAASGDLEATIRNIDAARRDVRDTKGPLPYGFGETGLLGSILRYIPGTAAYDLGDDVDTIQSSTAFDKLQRMRELSPTGGALGGVAVPELEMLKKSLGSVNPNQSQANFEKNAAKVRARYLDMLRRVDPKTARNLTPKTRAPAKKASGVKFLGFEE